MLLPIPPCYGIIPARYASSRFPGKPLADILGKPMFWHVYERARRCSALIDVALATDDDRIMAAAQNLGVPAVMTRPDHPSGTDRVMEAALALGVSESAVVVNIQGDEPLLDPEMLDQLVAPFSDPDTRVATLAIPIDHQEALRPDRVKVVMDDRGRALYFSRAPIPWLRDGEADDDAGTHGSHYLGHVGLYAFRMRALARFVSLPPGRLERIERLEQLRLLENGIPIRVVETTRRSIGVDRPEDIRRVVEMMRANSECNRSDSSPSR